MNTGLVQNLISWGIPPLAGAVIGYVTNAIAIKMLFRPLTEKRVFGIKVPFTPGILPRQRHKLAESIGRMVERELLTPELLRERLFRDDIRSKFREAIANMGEKMLGNAQKLSLPDSLKPLLKDFLTNAYPQFTALLISFLREPEIHLQLETQGRLFIRRAMENFNSLQRFFITTGKYDETLRENMGEIIDSLIEQVDGLLSTEATRERLLEKIGGSSLSLGSLLKMSEEKRQALYERLCDYILNLADSQIENVLALVNVKKMVSDRIDALEMERVERIVLDVLAGQLKWINILGGILGGLIGLFQAGLSRFLN
jgi:uncharacterized membrane protein YheB (UPF0754 family)